jgi:hypothetical protein
MSKAVWMSAIYFVVTLVMAIVIGRATARREPAPPQARKAA